MRRLLPEYSADVDLFESFTGQSRAGSRVRLGMVMSVDGSVTDEEGWTSRLGGKADRRVLAALRAVSDAILVGAGSIRTGRYPPHRPTAEYRERRRCAGMPEFAPLVVVTRGHDIDWSLPAFTDARTPTLIVTCARAEVPLSMRDHVLVAGDTDVDLAAGLTGLRERYGLRNVVCEGGPGLATSLFANRLVDELVLSIASSIVPGTNRRLVANMPHRQELELRELYEEDGGVFLRYEVLR